MKKIRRIFSLLLVCLPVLLLTNCSNLHKPNIEEVITDELDLLKNLDTNTTQKYISYKELFPDAEKNSAIPPEVEEVFSLFFKNFNYKILSLDVEENTAIAQIRLQTIDAKSLAEDFSAARLSQSITAASKSQNTDDEEDNSLKAHYLLLYKILKEKEYDTVETNCTMHLLKSDDMWYIQGDRTLENELVGGFISYLADSRLLSAKDAAEVYFSTIKEMDEAQFASYLGLQNSLNLEDTDQKALSRALISQAHKQFDYKILKAADDGFTAKVDLELNTMDTQKILTDYTTEFDAYLATSDAVIDGVSGRHTKSQELLLKKIQDTNSTSSAQVQVTLINNGITWKLKMDDSIGNVLFGNLANSSEPAEETEIEEKDTEEE